MNPTLPLFLSLALLGSCAWSGDAPAPMASPAAGTALLAPTQPDPAPAPAILSATPPAATAASGRLTFAPMIKRVEPSVVTVFSTRTVHLQNQWAPLLKDDPFLRQFVDPGAGVDRREQGLGSGVVVSSEGYILTNNHVVENADTVKVGFADSPEEYTAKVIGSDPKTDIAVLKIDAGKRPLLPITFGDSTRVEVGDVVFAIGNPFGVGETVTMGIISAVGRAAGLAEYEDFLQTDASINPGNSGGALVDSEGRLVGINTAIVSPSGGNLGIGFAVPAALAANVMHSIITQGKVVRGYLGVVIQNLDPLLAGKLGDQGAEGGLVADVEGNSPAAKAGIKATDVIVGIDGRRIEDDRHLRLTIAEMAPGEKVALAILRDGKPMTVDATLGNLSEAPAMRDRRKGGDENIEPQTEENHGGLGIRISDLTDDLRGEIHAPDKLQGAVITEVRPGSRADDAGLKAGMVIVEVERHGVDSAQAAADAIEKDTGDMLLTLWQDGVRLYRAIPHD